MKIQDFKKQIKGVFKQPKKHYYLGKLRWFSPYFYPIGFVPCVVNLRVKKKGKLIVPMVRRSWNKTFSFWKWDCYITIGSPIKFGKTNMGWKEKWNMPRFEWLPSYYFNFFKWQFVIYYTAPDIGIKYSDKYFEQALWYLKFYNDYNCTAPNIEKAVEKWGWVDNTTKQSTFELDYLLPEIKNMLVNGK